MKPKIINNTTYAYNNPDDDSDETVIGDEKQAKFYPRIKIKKWNNEVNLSVGIKDTPENATVVQNGESIEWKKNGVVARFYPRIKEKPLKPTAIRRVLQGDLIQPYEASAEYEFMRHRGNRRLTTIDIADYVTPPMLMHFDSMPSSVYDQIDDKGQAKDFNYPDKSGYHPSYAPMPSFNTIPANRIYSPYSISANPYFADEGLHNIDIQYGELDVGDITSTWLQAIKEVLGEHNIAVTGDSTKLFFEHKGQQVKFHSAENARGVLACYINIDCAYNKAYDFYKPEVQKDVRNQYAYGLKQAYPDIDHSVVGDIIERFAKLLSLPVDKSHYTSDEWAKVVSLSKIHQDIDWIRDGKRKDAGWFFRESRDEFELEVVLDSKPASNVMDFSIISKGLNFYYQDELTPKQKLTCQRPPDVVGSYAVYHKSKSNDMYGTGKACHIYRPIVIDANGWSYFCDLKIDINNELLRVTIPQEFLDKATYPIVLDPTFATFGSTSTPGSTSYISSGSTDFIVALVADGSIGDIDSMSAYLNIAWTSGTAKSQTALYKASNGSLVSACDAENSYTSSSTGWKSHAFTGDATLQATSYWLAVSGDHSAGIYDAVNMGFDAGTPGGNQGWGYAWTYAANGWPDPITVTLYDYIWAVYVSYTIGVNMSPDNPNCYKTGVKIWP